ncbi:FAD-dependent oxidoreductase [Cryptosporangium phraense]|uniref:FAD-dependent oxidoreductase n=1 Tax=Cryptosporangium phraense TaxID=2593070 RepID=A0A545ATW9_9ACTN|nr:FAD-dependent oxidoreductase [Cryptosporangium phraense]TQS44772.1 FAD-dependent oxidoreductase [Cryptosporangium phraense]
MAEQRDESFDFVIVGSGGGGLVAALAAHEAGLKPVILEKQPYVGGSTGMSGGVVWMPDNPLMRRDRVPDSYEDGLAYFDAVVGEPDQGSSLARREAFLRQGPEMVAFLERRGVEFVRCEGYSDYYSDRKGGSDRGRSIEGVPWDGRRLGEWHAKIIPGMAKGMGLAVKTNEVRSLPTWTRSFRSLRTTVRVGARTYVSRWRGQDLFTNGMSLVGQLTKILVEAGVPIWLNAGVSGLVVEGGRIVGVEADRGGEPVVVRGTHGVLLAAGGFERNPEMRRKYSADTQPNDGQWTMANAGNTGEVLAAAIAVGAKTDYMDDAVWLPNPRMELAGTAVALGRQYPHAIFVNAEGKRFVNESNSYLEVGKAMYAHDGVPCWLIFDDTFRKRYAWARGLPTLRRFASVLPGRMPEELVTSGWIKRSATLPDLAAQLGVDADALVATVGRFNVHAVQGEDPDFGRGRSQYNKALGDPGSKPNPSVGPVDTPPYYATQIYPGDVGTIGGVITDEHGRALDEADAPIPGLYVTGNMAATVMGRYYLGAGASISNTMTFGYLAARHAAGV